jgi:hypothetical protein
MSVQAMSWVLDHSDAELGSRLVLLSIANHCDADGRNAWPSQARIAAEAHVSERTVRRCVENLVDLGELTVGIHQGVLSGRGKTNYYEIPALTNVSHQPDNMSSGDEEPESNNRTSATEQPDISANNRTAVAGKPSLRTVHEPSTTSSALAADEGRPEVVALCEHLATRIEENGSKRPTITKQWLTSCRLLIDRDGRTPDQIHRAIDWCQNDEFWRGNVMSMPTLRAKYDTLRLRAKAPKKETIGQSKARRGLERLAQLEASNGRGLPA